MKGGHREREWLGEVDGSGKFYSFREGCLF